MTTKTGDFTGYSETGLDDAIKNALKKAGTHTHFEVIETRSSQLNDDKRHYQVTITAFFD